MTCACGYDAGSAKFCPGCGQALARFCSQCGVSVTQAAKFCGECGSRIGVESRAFTRREFETGERRQLTVLFCDLVGSAPLSQQLDPEEYPVLVRRYHEAATAVVTRYGGHVANDLGDGLLVYFGWPQAFDDAAERAARAGLQLIDTVRALDAPAPLAARVGIHTGDVVLAEIDGVARPETLGLGQTTNVAARLQSVAAPDTVVVSEATLRLMAGIFVTEDLGAQTLKGIATPVATWRVVQPSGVRSRLEVDPARLTPFVGRDMELGTLVDRWERAADGAGETVLVVGEPGVGKSRLAYQLRERLAAVPHTWLECRATPYTQGTPFFPVIELVAQGLGLTTEDSHAEKVGKIERALAFARIAPAEAMPLLADFLGLLPPKGYAPLTMGPDVQRRRTMELLTAWTLALAEGQPLVLLIEDLHWCDPSSLELFGRVITQSATAPILLVGTARPEFTSPWPTRSNVTTLQLARLTKRQAREMIGALAGRSLSGEMVDALVARADGVPLYVEELMKGVAEPDVGRGVDAVPATLADSLMARLDRLSTAKEVAQRAAVLGREFGYPLLAGVAGMEEATLRQGLARLVDAEIVFQRGEPPDAAYTFKHALVQEAAYGSLLTRTRQQLHGRVVQVFVERFPERVESEPEVVGRHAEAAGRIDDAITYYGRAGERAQARSAYEEAIGQLRKAITLLDTLPGGAERDARELSLQLALGGSFNAARGFAHLETAAAYERATALGTTAGDAASLGMARSGLSICYSNRGEVERGRAVAVEVLAAAEGRGDREQMFLGHFTVAVPEHWQGKFASSLAHGQQALDHYDPEQHHALVRAWGMDPGVVALGVAAWPLWHLGHPDAALARAREVVALARRLDDPFALTFALFWETNVHWKRRDGAAQRERVAEVIALSEGQGFPLWLGVGRALHAAARVGDGDFGALPEILEGMALAGETGNQGGVPEIWFMLAEAQQAAGQLVDAQGTVATGLRVAAQTGQPYFDADLHRLDGDLRLATGGPAAEAAARYHRALAVAREQGSRSLELRAATSFARLWRDQGKRAEARDLLAPVYGWFTEGFDTRDLIEAKALLQELS